MSDWETSGMIGMGVTAALADQYAKDQREFLPLIASVLRQTLPEQVDVIETGFFKKTVRGVVVNHGENQLKLEDMGRGPLQASFVRVVRGIALKTEPLSVQEWLTAVGEALEESTKSNLEARMALAKGLGLN